MALINFPRMWSAFEKQVRSDWDQARKEFDELQSGPNFDAEFTDIDRRLKNSRHTKQAIERLNVIRDHIKFHCRTMDHKTDEYLQQTSRRVVVEYSRAKDQRLLLGDFMVEHPSLDLKLMLPDSRMDRDYFEISDEYQLDD